MLVVPRRSTTFLMHPSTMLGVIGVFGGSLFSAMHGCLSPVRLVRETTPKAEKPEITATIRPGRETYNIVAAHGYFAA